MFDCMRASGVLMLWQEARQMKLRVLLSDAPEGRVCMLALTTHHVAATATLRCLSRCFRCKRSRCRCLSKQPDLRGQSRSPGQDSDRREHRSTCIVLKRCHGVSKPQNTPAGIWQHHHMLTWTARNGDCVIYGALCLLCARGEPARQDSPNDCILCSGAFSTLSADLGRARDVVMPMHVSWKCLSLAQL